MKVSKVRKSAVVLFTAIISPLENSSSTHLCDTHFLIFFWSLSLHHLFSFDGSSSSNYTEAVPFPADFTGSLLSSHTLAEAPTHGVPTPDDYQISSSLSEDCFSDLQNEDLPADHLFFYGPWAPQTQNVQTHVIFPHMCPLFCIHLLSRYILFPTWDLGVLWDLCYSLPQN